MSKANTHPRTLGLALGSGSARGWSHIGILRELTEMGLEPDMVCGSSIGAMVGAFYVGGKLDALEELARSLTRFSMAEFLDIGLASRGGFIQGERLTDFFHKHLGEVLIEDLARPFASVATGLTTGREIWFTRGSLAQAIRASISLPAIFTPVEYEEDWLVDGGLVNPVPVSVCRALGADAVIAVNLNGDIVGRHFRGAGNSNQLESPAMENENLKGWIGRARGFVDRLFEPDKTPGMLDVMAGSLNIMQDRITRSRMAGDPPEVLLTPRLGHLELMDFERADEAIQEGRACVRRSYSTLEYFFSDRSPAGTKNDEQNRRG